MNAFNEISQGLRDLIDEWEPILLALPADIISERRNTQNRTVKQIVGHMCDSATNNTHRTIHLHYGKTPLHFPNYASHGNNDRWIAIQHYQEEDWFSLIQLWKYANLHIAHIFRHVDDTKLHNLWDAGDGKMISMKEGITDYLRHFKLHLDEISALINPK